VSERRLRIAIVAEAVNQHGGQERVVAELCRSWADRHDLDLFCFSAEDLPTDRVRVHRLWLPLRSNTFQIVWIVLMSWLAVRPRRYDVVLSQGGNCLVQNFVLAHTCHARRRQELLRSAEPASRLRRGLLLLRNRWARAFERRAVRRCRGRLIVVWPALARMFAEEYGLPREEILVAPNGVDHTLFSPEQREVWREPLRRGLGLGDEARALLFVGGLWLEKGLGQALAALAAMREPAQLLVLGRGDEREFGELAESLGVRERVRFLGHREDPERYMAAADCFVFPSPLPWLTLATVEAAASGLPLVIARLADTEEYFEEGVSAFLIGPSGEEMSERLDRLTRDPELRGRMGEAARAAVRSLSWERQAETLEKFLLAHFPTDRAALRLAAISHSAVLEVNQALYAALAAAHPELELLLIVPERWPTALTGGKAYQAARTQPFVRPLPVHWPGKLHQHWYGPELGRALREFRPEVLLLHEEYYSLAAAQAAHLARRLGARLLPYTNQSLHRSYPPPFSWIRNSVLRQATRMLVLSEACAEALRASGYRGPVDLLPYPFALPDDPPPDPDLRERLGLTSPVIGFVGRLEPQKGLMDLLEAAALLRAAGQDFSLLFAGEGRLRPEMEAFAAERLAPGQAVFAGYVPHERMGAYFQAMDVFVLASRTTPSWTEQFGRVLLEAWGYGVPVAGSDSGHIPQLIRETGGGLIFHEGDPADLAARLTELLAAPERARERGRAAREIVKREYSLERVAEKLWDSVAAAARQA
jgi:glycosyltransferase involved in cell wall biosynthesis